MCCPRTVSSHMFFGGVPRSTEANKNRHPHQETHGPATICCDDHVDQTSQTQPTSTPHVCPNVQRAVFGRGSFRTTAWDPRQVRRAMRKRFQHKLAETCARFPLRQQSTAINRAATNDLRIWMDEANAAADRGETFPKCLRLRGDSCV